MQQFTPTHETRRSLAAAASHTSLSARASTYKPASCCSAAFRSSVLRTMPAAFHMSCVRRLRLEATQAAALTGRGRAAREPTKSAAAAA